jgi:hypothetical protein
MTGWSSPTPADYSVWSEHTVVSAARRHAKEGRAMTQVQDAPTAQGSISQWASEDVGNIVMLEHVNTCVDDQLMATSFYLVGMGFTRDPYMNVGLNNMWVNVGAQQFHLPSRTPQVFSGHTGIVVPDLGALTSRLEMVKDALKDTAFAYAYAAKDDHVSVTTPWGNELRCYAPAPRFGDVCIGIPYVEVLTRRGTADGIARFYRQVMQAPASVQEDGGDAVAQVKIGTYQWLNFRESDQEIRPYDGHHIAVYIANFSGPYEWLKQRDLIKEDVRNHQFRMQEIVDPESGEHLKTFEHEVRGLFHPMYRREMVNRDASQNMAGYARGRDALIPSGV